LLQIVADKKLIAAVAYHWRFNWALQKLRTWLLEERFDDPISVSAFVGEQVADWHSWEDHRNSYACRRDLGGGVILTLSHDIDMLYWLFGMPERIKAVGGNLVHKDIDVEDTAEIVMHYKRGLVASLHMDYWRPVKKREMDVFGKDSRFEWASNYVAHWPYYDDGPIREHCGPEESEETRNQMHLSMTQQFIAAIKGGPMAPLCDLWQAAEVMRIALAARAQILPYIKKGESSGKR
jgi:predicted dehydrogenase